MVCIFLNDGAFCLIIAHERLALHHSTRQVDGTDTQSMDDLQDVLQKGDKVGDKVIFGSIAACL